MGALSALAGRRVYLDANVFVYALEALPPWDQIANAVFQLLDTGQASAVTSEFTLTECLVKPLRTANQIVAQVYLDAIRDRPELTVVPVSRTILIETARLRAMHPTLKPPDALHAATAILQACDVLLTNDARLVSAGLSLQVELLSATTP
jgi:predicted nucleic acid-binding protein